MGLPERMATNFATAFACQTDLELIESDGRISVVFDGVRVALLAVAQQSINLMGCGQRWVPPALLAIVGRLGRWKKRSIFYCTSLKYAFLSSSVWLS